jgi:hypothetical protein
LVNNLQLESKMLNHGSRAGTSTADVLCSH